MKMAGLLTQQMKQRVLHAGGALCLMLDMMISRFL